MFKINLVGSKSVTVSDFANFEANEDSFELVDIINTEPQKNNESFVSAPGYFVYELEIDVNMQKALDERLEGFEIKIYPDNPNMANMVLEESSSKSSNAKNFFAKSKQLFDNFKLDPIFEGHLPIYKKLPNDLINKGINNEKLKAETSKFVMIASENFLTDSKLPATALKAKNTTPTEALSGSKKNFNHAQKDSLQKTKTDPASLFKNKSPVIIPTARSYENNSISNQNAGTYSENLGAFEVINKIKDNEKKSTFSFNSNFHKISLREIRKKELEKLNKSNSILKFEQKKIANNLVKSAGSNSLKEYNDDSKNDSNFIKTLGYQFVIESNVKNHKFLLKIPKENLGSSNYIYFSIKPIIKNYESKGLILNETYYFASHRNQLQKILIPVVPPKITVTENKIWSTPCQSPHPAKKISFMVEQLDPTANFIVATKRLVDPNFRDQGFEILSESVLNMSKKIEINDYNPGNIIPNSVIYRVICRLDDLDGAFDSIAFDGIKHPFIPGDTDPPNDLSIISRNLQDGIQLELDKFPIGVSAISLCREEINANGSFKERNSIVANNSNKKVFNIKNSEKISLLDTNVAPGRSYRYYALMYFDNGLQKKSSEDELVIRSKPSPNHKNPFEVEISSMELTLKQNSFYEVSNNIKITPKESSFQFVKQIFQEQNALEGFENFISNNRDKIDQLIAIKVERIDRDTGKRYDLGVHKAGEFTDGARISTNLGVPLVTPGGRYIYNFRICLINPLSVLYDTISQLSSGRNPGFRDVTFNPNIFNNVSLNSGLLPSTRNLINQPNFNDAIIKGDIGINIRREIKIPKIRAYIEEIKMSVSRRNTILLWEILGDPSEVDYAIVEVNLRGDSQIINTVARSGKGSTMMAVDHIYSNEVGNRYYSITLVYNDSTLSDKKTSEVVNTFSNVKPTALQNAFADNQFAISSLMETADSKLSSFGGSAQLREELSNVGANNTGIRRF